jgi:Phage Terminase
MEWRHAPPQPVSVVPAHHLRTDHRAVGGSARAAGKHARTKLRLRQWQRRFVEAVYREDKRGIRPIRTAVLSMARKNGKSQLAAALALCHLCGPEAESRGEIYSCANDRFQAGRIFDENGGGLVCGSAYHPLGRMCTAASFQSALFQSRCPRLILLLLNAGGRKFR